MALSAFYDSFALDCFALGVVGGLSGVKTILRHLRKHKANFFTSFFWQFPENFGIGFTMIPSRSFQPRIPPKIATRFYLALQPAFTRGCRLYRGDASAMMLGLSLEVWSIWGVRIASVLYHDVFHLPHILGCSLFSMPHHGMSLRDFTKAWVIPLQASGISLEISWGWVKTYYCRCIVWGITIQLYQL